MGARRRVLVLAVVAGCTDGATDPSPDTTTGQPMASSTGGEPLPTTSGNPDLETTDPSTTEATSTTGDAGTSTTSDSTASTDVDVSSSGSSTGTDDAVVPDFALIDVNSNSASYNQPVSPRDYLEMVSGWYFTHAT